jgi:hypothetical protein
VDARFGSGAKMSTIRAFEEPASATNLLAVSLLGDPTCPLSITVPESKVPSAESAYIVAGNSIRAMPHNKRVLRATRSSQVMKVAVVLLTSSMTMDSRRMRKLQ